MNRAEEAARCFAQGASCSQAVLTAFCEELGLPRPVAFKVAAGFGGGMGRLGQTCGAVTGAIMVVGLRQGASGPADRATKERTYAQVRELVARFQARHGSVLCRELLGIDISTETGWQQAREQQLFATRCPAFVRSAVEILEELGANPPGRAV